MLLAGLAAAIENVEFWDVLELPVLGVSELSIIFSRVLFMVRDAG